LYLHQKAKNQPNTHQIFLKANHFLKAGSHE